MGHYNTYRTIKLQMYDGCADTSFDLGTAINNMTGLTVNPYGPYYPQPSIINPVVLPNLLSPSNIQVMYTAHSGISAGQSLPRIPDASDILRFACMVGKRMLIKPTSSAYSYNSYSTDNITEIKVVEFSPSYEYVKIEHPSKACSWYDSIEFLKEKNKILEILDIEDKEDKEGIEDDKSTGMPKL